MPVFDDYLARLAADQREALERARAVVAATVPDAEEGTSYGMPALIRGGRPRGMTRGGPGREPMSLRVGNGLDLQ